MASYFASIFFALLKVACGIVPYILIAVIVGELLSGLPLGAVLDMPSGTLKNILIERIDSMETTLAHILPEWTSNLILPLVMFVYLFHIDWRMGLASLVTLPVGMISASFMMINMTERFKNAIEKTKILNDTAVEYINGIKSSRLLENQNHHMKNL